MPNHSLNVLVVVAIMCSCISPCCCYCARMAIVCHCDVILVFDSAECRRSGSDLVSLSFVLPFPLQLCAVACTHYDYLYFLLVNIFALDEQMVFGQ